MNSSDSVRENTKGRFRTVIGICLCCMILGFLLGVALDAEYRPNKILLYINPDGKVSLSPNPGDIISFEAFDDETGAKIDVGYTADLIPCEKNAAFPPSTCVYAPFTDGPNLYLFGCSTSAGKVPCYDPQYGPKCSGCPNNQQGHTGYALLFLNVLGEDLGGLLRIFPVKRMLPENHGGPTVPSPPPPPPSSVIEVATKCNGSAPAVYLSGSSTPTTSIPARPLDTITWNNYDRDYAIANLNICTQSELPSSGGKNQSCTIKGGSTGTVTYTLTMTCNNVKTNVDETISLP